MSDTAKKFLVVEEPNVPAFMILQLLLFQYPNGMGVAYYSNSDSVRIQANTRDRTLEFIGSGIRLSPFRLICKAIEAKSILKSTSVFDVDVNIDEVFALANDGRVNKKISPDVEQVVEVLEDFEKGNIKPPDDYENRFHILKHTNFLEPSRKSICLRTPLNKEDRSALTEKLYLINSIDEYFDGFDGSENSDDLLKPIIDASWGRYFDGVKTLNSSRVEILTSEKGYLDGVEDVEQEKEEGKQKVAKVYPFRKRISDTKEAKSTRKTDRVDPEITRIKRQRSNLIHKVLLQQLEEYLESLGCDPVENDHIDMFAKLPYNGKYIFEVKSTTNENLLSQTRKGISQLYEYRFRYQDEVGYDVNLCLVMPGQPKELDWLEEYLFNDRNIGLIWFDDDGQIQTSSNGKSLVQTLFNPPLN